MECPPEVAMPDGPRPTVAEAEAAGQRAFDFMGRTPFAPRPVATLLAEIAQPDLRAELPEPETLQLFGEWLLAQVKRKGWIGELSRVSGRSQRPEARAARRGTTVPARRPRRGRRSRGARRCGARLGQTRLAQTRRQGPLTRVVERCRLRTTNDRESLVEELADRMCNARRDRALDPDCPNAGAYWQQTIRLFASDTIRMLGDG